MNITSKRKVFCFSGNDYMCPSSGMLFLLFHFFIVGSVTVLRAQAVENQPYLVANRIMVSPNFGMGFTLDQCLSIAPTTTGISLQNQKNKVTYTARQPSATLPRTLYSPCASPAHRGRGQSSERYSSIQNMDVGGALCNGESGPIRVCPLGMLRRDVCTQESN